MDVRRFDSLTKSLATHLPRRSIVARLFGAAAILSARPLSVGAQEQDPRTYCDPMTGECQEPILPSIDDLRELAELSKSALADIPPPGDAAFATLPDEVASFVENARRAFELGTLGETLTYDQFVGLAEQFEGADLGRFTGIYLAEDPEKMLTSPEGAIGGVRALPAAYLCSDCWTSCRCRSWDLKCKTKCNARNLWCTVNCVVR